MANKTPRIVWLVAITWLLGYEVWALINGYEWTLTAGARGAVADYPWLAGVLAAFLAWFGVHILIEKRRQK